MAHRNANLKPENPAFDREDSRSYSGEEPVRLASVSISRPVGRGVAPASEGTATGARVMGWIPIQSFSLGGTKPKPDADHIEAVSH